MEAMIELHEMSTRTFHVRRTASVRRSLSFRSREQRGR
jgi:hypothetical protein